MDFFLPQIWEENGGASYSPNVAYLARYRISALKDVIKYFTTLFASKFFPYFPPLKPRCVLWSENTGNCFVREDMSCNESTEKKAERCLRR